MGMRKLAAVTEFTATLSLTMIVKEYTPAPTSDRFKRAGDEAEKQMAFYLRRAFGDNPNVHVFNNLRLEHEGEVVQIDHLIFHRAGFVIVESKSVTSSVRINDREEWARQWNGRWSGMPSPVLQAKRQADLLRTLLQAHKVDLRNKILFGLKQGGFGAFIIDVVVAISDSGVIQHRGKLPEVKKADQVPDHVKALLTEHSQLAHPLSRDKRSEEWGFNLSPEEFTRISAFLRTRHRDAKLEAPSPETEVTPSPRPFGRHAPVEESPQPERHVPPASQPEVVTPTPAPPQVLTTPVVVQCGKCGSGDVEIKFGHSYYLHCRSCDGNSPIKLTCPSCSGRQRIRKSGMKFYAECAACQTSQLHFTNP